MNSSHPIHSIGCIISMVVCAGSGRLRGETPLVNPDNWTVNEMGAIVEGGGVLNINATFVGKPWVDYAVFATLDFTNWAPLGLAPERLAGDYSFHHSTVADHQFYHAEITLPGPIKTLDAHYYGKIAGLSAAGQRYALAYNHETLHAIRGGTLQLGQAVEQASQALMGMVNVVDLQNGSFQVSWAGNQQIANGPAARDAAAQNFQQQRNATQMQLQQTQDGLGKLGILQYWTPAVEPLAIEEGHVADCESAAITTHLPLPVGPAYLMHDAPLAWLGLDTVTLDKTAVEKEKAALQQRIAKLRQEEARKRQLAAAPTQVFGINGVWFVRWANVELTFPSQAQALSVGVPQMNALKAQRLAEADALDAEADGLEAQLPALCAKLAALNASLAVLTPDYQAKLAAHPGGLTNPVDTAHPKPRWGRWIGFDPMYVDPIWEELYRAWQARKDALRNELIAMGASQQAIDDAMRRMSQGLDPRRKWMSIFSGEPIKLQLFTVNQFTNFEMDTANAKWEVEYENYTTGKIERVQVGTGGELCLTAEQAQQIYDHAHDVQHSGVNRSVLVSINVRFDRVFPDGKRVEVQASQQVIITSTTRAEHNAVFGGLSR